MLRSRFSYHLGLIAGACAALLASLRPSQAFPPAPDHQFYGMVRDELGNPLSGTDAEVMLETSSGVQIKGSILNGTEAGVNYRLSIPMDAGITADVYKPTALQPSVPFKMWVRVGGVRYLPIQMKGDYSQLGQPGKRTRLDLTLGEDTDGDGLPDAWERALIAMLGGGLTLADIKPGDDPDHDGLTNLQEYLAGTYAFDPKDGFSLSIVGASNSNPLLEFLAIRGRSYTVMGSSDLKAWNPVQFRVAGTDAAAGGTYYASDTRTLKIEAMPDGSTKFNFFKLMVQ